MSKIDVARLREPAAWIMLVAGLTSVLLAIGHLLVGSSSSSSFTGRAVSNFFGLTDPVVTALLLGAVLLVTKIGTPSDKAKAITYGAAVGLLLASLFGMLTLLLGLFAGDGARPTVEFVLLGVPRLALTGVALVYLIPQALPARPVAPVYQGHFGQPQQGFGGPQDQGYGPHDQLFGQHDQPFGQQDQAFGQADQPFGQPQQAGYGQQPPAPQPSPAQHPAHTPQDQPTPGYGPQDQPAPGYGPQDQPAPGYGPQQDQPAPGYGPQDQPAPGYGLQEQPAPGYGQQPVAAQHELPAVGYGQQPPTGQHSVPGPQFLSGQQPVPGQPVPGQPEPLSAYGQQPLSGQQPIPGQPVPGQPEHLPAYGQQPPSGQHPMPGQPQPQPLSGQHAAPGQYAPPADPQQPAYAPQPQQAADQAYPQVRGALPAAPADQQAHQGFGGQSADSPYAPPQGLGVQDAGGYGTNPGFAQDPQPFPQSQPQYGQDQPFAQSQPQYGQDQQPFGQDPQPFGQDQQLFGQHSYAPADTAPTVDRPAAPAAHSLPDYATPAPSPDYNTPPPVEYQPAPYVPADSQPTVYGHQSPNPYAPPDSFTTPSADQSYPTGETSPNVSFQPPQQQAYYGQSAFDQPQQGGSPLTGYSGAEFAATGAPAAPGAPGAPGAPAYQEPDLPVDPRSQQLLDAYQQAETYQSRAYETPFGHPQQQQQPQPGGYEPRPYQPSHQAPAAPAAPAAPGWNEGQSESTMRLDPSQLRGGDALDDQGRPGDDPINPTAIYTPNEPRR
ncbi:hypothetical protein [Nonomuraea wenchangensis]|uniref:hypothetical protein n=1 Tax=Nonomuraea wenchangensis TaxID=568860 RepID=UPI003448FC19